LKSIYVGNLSFQSSEDSISKIFARHGKVTSVRIISDLETGRSRGFCFVEMPDDQEAEAAISALNNYEMDGRQLKVNEARPQRERVPYRDR
jgi:RNA recognition motif-containing protein